MSFSYGRGERTRALALAFRESDFEGNEDKTSSQTNEEQLWVKSTTIQFIQHIRHKINFIKLGQRPYQIIISSGKYG